MKRKILLFLLLLLLGLNVVAIASVKVELYAKWPLRFPKEPDMIEIDKSGGRVFCGFGNFIHVLDDNLEVLSSVNLGIIEDGIQAIKYSAQTKVLYVAVGRQGIRLIDASTNILSEISDIQYPDYLIAAHTDISGSFSDMGNDTNSGSNAYKYFIDDITQKSFADLDYMDGHLYLADYFFGLRNIDVNLSQGKRLEEVSYYKSVGYTQYYAGGFHNIVLVGPRAMKIPQRDAEGNIIKDANNEVLFENETEDIAYAFILDRYLGLRVIDLSELILPEADKIDFSEEDKDAEANKDPVIVAFDMLSKSQYYQESLVSDIVVVDNRVYITDLGRGLTILNINYDNFYVTDNDGNTDDYPRIEPYYGNNIFDPNSTSAYFDENATEEDLLSGVAIGLEVLNDYAYVVGTESGLTIVDINETLASTKTEYDREKDDLADIKAAGTHTDSEIDKLEIHLQRTRDQNIVGRYLRNVTIPHDIQLYSKDSHLYAFIADYLNGLIKVDVTDPAAVSETFETEPFDTPSGADSLCVYSTDPTKQTPYIYMVDDDGPNEGLRILSIIDNMEIQKLNDDGSPVFDAVGKPVTNLQPVIDIKLLGFYATPGEAKGIDVTGNYAYIADGTKGLHIVNISDPTLANPSSVTYDTLTDACDVVVADGFAYVADGVDGLKIIDVSDPTRNDGEIYSYSDFNDARGVFVSGGYAYVADGVNGLRKIDISGSKNEQDNVVTTYPAAIDAEAVFVEFNYAYVADGSYGLRVIDIGKSPQNEPVFTVQTSGDAQDVSVYKGYAYVAVGVKGLDVIDLNERFNGSASDADTGLNSNYDSSGNPLGETKAVFIYPLPPVYYDTDKTSEYVFLADGMSGVRMMTATFDDTKIIPLESKGLDSGNCFISIVSPLF